MWKALSEKDKDNWDTIQVTFLCEACKSFGANHNSSTKFSTANQKSEEARGLAEKEKKIYENSLKEGKCVQGNIFRKLSGKGKRAIEQGKRNQVEREE
eukprot:15055634-Ditylum_brightwellii.AAC.1